jgi:hypothetical protein
MSFLILTFVVIAYLWGRTIGQEIVDFHEGDLCVGSGNRNVFFLYKKINMAISTKVLYYRKADPANPGCQLSTFGGPNG